MIRLSLGLIASLSITAAAYGQEPAGEEPPRIQITPRQSDQVRDQLEAYPANPNYDARVHSVLALRAAEAALSENDSDGARDLLEDTLDQLDPSTAAGRAAQAAVRDALATLARRAGDLNERLGHARAAFGVLEEGDAARPWARIKMAAAYAEAEYQMPNANYQAAALRQLRRLKHNDDLPAAVQDYAAIVEAMISRKARGDARKAIAVIEEIVSKPGQLPEIVSGGRIAQIRLHHRAGREEEAERLLTELQNANTELDTLEVLPLDTARAVQSGGGHGRAVAERRSFQAQDLSPPPGGTEGWKFESLLAGSWAEVSYCIRPDGTVDSVTVLDQDAPDRWVRNLTGHIAAKRYTATQDDGDCRFRYERFEVATNRIVRAGSRLKRQGESHYLVTTDLLENRLFDRSLLAVR